MPGKIQFESKVISIGSESSDLYMTLDMVFLDNLVNLNGVKFTDEFLCDIETNKSVYIGLPLVGDMSALVGGKYDKLTHKFNKKTGDFGTQALGSFIDFRTEKTDDLVQLIATARIWKRFPSVCASIEDLFNDEDGLKFSYECYASNYEVDSGIKIIDKGENNSILSSCIVSNPANPNSVGTLLIAELLESDNQSIKGGEQGNMQRSKDTFTVENMFENSKINLAELDINQVKTKLFNQLREKMEDDYWMYDSQDMGVDYVVLKNYSTAELIKVEFSVVNNEITILDTYNVDKAYIKKVISSNEEEDLMKLAELELKVTELETEIASKNAIIETSKVELASVNEQLVAKDVVVAEVNEKLTSVSETLIAKETEIAEFAPIKEAHETIIAEKSALELAEKKTALKEKYTKLLDEKVMAEVEIAEAIEALNESVLKDAVIEKALASVVAPIVKIETASRITDTVVIGKGSDLLSKYITINE
ncbi:hypothetical protein [Clostridium sp.]|uniref:hypothetical protein n=1 Tax=Clostridium sp. TaxID=1506 RepID=UPI001A59CDDF|nr:hypothetical protein [Clostridium sp.]MBK5239808.1 hypothetical protein [Clostridium sp.]